MSFTLNSQQLRNEADRLGIPWTSATTDDELTRLVGAHETQNVPVEDTPECFGLWWEAVGDSPCVQCDVKDQCLDRFTETTLVKARAVLPNASMDELAKKLQVAEAAVLVALNHQQQPRRTPVTEESEVPAKKKPPKKKKKATKKKVVKKTKKVAKKVVKKRRKKLPPPRAGSAKSAKGPARKKRRRRKKKKSVKRARGQAESVGWSKKTYRQRWKRERKRSRWIASLVPGMKLKKLYQGEMHEIAILQGHYRYQKQDYPTLYKVVETITGKVPRPKQPKRDGTPRTGTRQICNWSASRFFNLPKLLTEMDRGPEE